MNAILQSPRLTLRNWADSDLDEFAALNADPAVMEHFPSTLTTQETAALMERLRQHYDRFGYTYFAAEVSATGEFIGFIGLAHQDYASPFTPATDIGWRLKKSAWGKGYATEGARGCLEFAFSSLALERVIAVCPLGNVRSARVMQNVGMVKQGTFLHPKLEAFPAHQACYCYAIER